MQITEPGADKAASNHLFAYTVEEYDAANGQKAKSWTRINSDARLPTQKGRPSIESRPDLARHLPRYYVLFLAT